MCGSSQSSVQAEVSRAHLQAKKATVWEETAEA